MIELTGHEVSKIKSLLPIQGNLSVLESVQRILDKIPEDCQGDSISIDFSKDDILFLCQMIDILDQACKINLDSFSLVKKILKKGVV